MAESHVISALVKKYSEIHGKLDACEKQAGDYKNQLEQIRAVVHMFQPDFDMRHITPKRPMRMVLKPKMFMRSAMDTLRDAKEPLTALDIAQQAFHAQGIQPEPKVLQRFSKQLYNALVVREKEGSAVSDDSFPRRWKINPN